MELALIATGLIDAVFSGSLLKMYSAKESGVRLPTNWKNRKLKWNIPNF